MINTIFDSTFLEKNEHFDLHFIIQNLKKTTLTQEKYIAIFKAFTEYFITNFFSEIEENAVRHFVLDRELNAALTNDFKNDLIKLIDKYKKNFPTPCSSLFLELIQLNLIDKLEAVKKECDTPIASELEKVLPQLLNKIKKGRPRSTEYDKLLVTLKDILTDNNGSYMSKLLELLTAVKKEYPNFLEGFEINENSLRTKLSKIQNSPCP